MSPKFIRHMSRRIHRHTFPIFRFILDRFFQLTYNLLSFFFNLIFYFFVVLFESLKYPFTSYRNFWRGCFSLLGTCILLFSLLLNLVYLSDTAGAQSVSCFFTNLPQNNPKNKVVRIIGDYSQGSGFFISDTAVLTNFHVISGEPSPKIVLPDGSLISPYTLTSDPILDLAMLQVNEKHPELVLPISHAIFPVPEDTPLFAYGYPMGTTLLGEATVAKGRLVTTRQSDTESALIQSDMNLIEGMSGGPMTDFCGRVVGINTLGMSGLSMFIPAQIANNSLWKFTDKDIEKVILHPEESPEKAVEAYYTYLKLHRMEPAYNLLSASYQSQATFEEWSSRFSKILSVYVVKTERVKGEKDKIFVKFVTTNWVNNKVETHYYEGVWVTVWEKDVFKLSRSMIKEVLKPADDWAMQGPEF